MSYLIVASLTTKTGLYANYNFKNNENRKTSLIIFGSKGPPKIFFQYLKSMQII